jgi:hypothetical protein
MTNAHTFSLYVMQLMVSGVSREEAVKQARAESPPHVFKNDTLQFADGSVVTLHPHDTELTYSLAFKMTDEKKGDPT